jgi:TolB-like protein/Tfp pilus assembly protein PilF
VIRSAVNFLKELRRRRVFRVAGLYVVAMWLLMQAANILFPAWGIPDAAINFLLWAGLLGFPVALVFGWVFDISTAGIRRTQPVGSQDELLRSLPLRRADYLILSAFLVVVGALVYDTTGRVLETTTAAGGVNEWRPSMAEIEPNSVAVLPFTDLSPEGDQAYFTDGISEEILNRLSAFRELKVIARTSSFVFKDSGYDIGRISGLLAVNYLLQGSVRRDGQQLRISAQLVDRSGVQVWSSTFDRQLGAIFAMQDEIAEAVATSIVPQISPQPQAERLPAIEAYQEYLVGRQILTARGAVFFYRSAERFTRAIELDPDFAEPYAGRAISLLMGAQWASDYATELDRAQDDIETALELNPNLALAYAAQALLHQRRNPEGHAEREILLRRALAIDPNLVDAMNWLAGALSGQGRHEEAIEVLLRAVRIDPLATVINSNLAMNEARRGRVADAERRLLRLLEAPQPLLYPAGMLAQIYESTGRLVESCAAAKRVVLSSVSLTGEPGGVYYLIRCYAVLGMWEASEFWNARREQAWPDSYQVRLMSHLQQEGRYSHVETLSALDAVLDQEDISLALLDRGWSLQYAILQALAGDYAGAIGLLELVLDPGVARQGIDTELEARHALAWAWQQTGAGERAEAMLRLMDEDFRRQEFEGRLLFSGDIFDFARNAVLLSDTQRALGLLEQAEQSGWRGYYAILRDPRWDAVREEPRFTAVLARVEADIGAQRARMAQIDAEDQFAARLDAVAAARPTDVPPTGGTLQNR